MSLQIGKKYRAIRDIPTCINAGNIILVLADGVDPWEGWQTCQNLSKGNLLFCANKRKSLDSDLILLPSSLPIKRFQL